MLDVDVWHEVRQKMRTGSATGACGFSVAEVKSIPRAALAHLAQLFHVSAKPGLPPFLLLGRVNVLAKVMEPQGHHEGRPICVLPVLYRLWGSVLCKQLLHRWCTYLPRGIYGGVPGRSARDITYSLQFQLEQAAHSNAPLSGFVLDIQKCFNALPRRPMHALLCHLGCPEQLATMWIQGLGRLGRASSFVGDISEPIWSSTGAPEGDGVSVAAAVAVGWLYSRVIEDYGLSPMIFVDNWAWVSEDHELNTAGVEQTVKFAEAFKLSIDWTKSFGWSRHPDGQKWWRDSCDSIGPPGVTLQVLAEAKDLGAAMRYHGPKVLGALKIRVQEARQRLHRLAVQPRSVANKAKLIQSAIWPVAFFACEGHALGRQQIASLRSAAARTLVGPFQQISSFLALSCLSQSLQDPEVYLLVSAFPALRRASFVDRTMADSILSMAVTATGQPHTVVGPATALKALLVRNGWTLHPSSLLTGPGNVRLHLFTSSSRDIARAVQISWLYHVRATLMHRKGLGSVGVPCPSTCHSVLRALPSSQQRTVALHVVGAFQTSATKFLWGGAVSPACPWCGEDETRPHRFLHCSAFQALRTKHSQAVHILRTHRPEWVYAPFPTVPDEVDILTLIFQSRPPPSWPHASWAGGGQSVQSLRFFTDGTCAHPTEALASHAAWAPCVGLYAYGPGSCGRPPVLAPDRLPPATPARR